MRYFYLFLASLLFFGNLKPAQAQTTRTGNYLPGKLVFKLKPEYKSLIQGNAINSETLNNTFSALKATDLFQKYPKAQQSDHPEAVDLSLIFQLKTGQNVQLEQAQKLLLKTGLLEYAEPLRYYEPLLQPNDPLSDSTNATLQFYLKRIRAYHAWDFEQGDTSIVIGILDTGIRYSHQDLVKKIKFNYADRIDGIDNDNDGFVDNFRGWDMADNDNNATADATSLGFQYGHGVGVTGVAAANAQNGKGIAGVGFKCKFLPIKIYASTATGSFAGYEAIVYAADHGCDVINLSWGGYNPFSAYEQDIITYATVNKNRVVVAAAGNTNAKLDLYPASYKYVLSVGALNDQNVKGGNNTYSHKIDLMAPGVAILSTVVSNDSAYNYVSGSSYATPMVAGAAALVKKKFPNFNAEQIAEQLRTTADASIYSIPGNAPYAGQLGRGILDMTKALSSTNAKSVRYMEVRPNNNGRVYPGDTLKLFVDFKNFLAPLANLNVTVSSTSPYVTVLQRNYAAGAMATLSSKTNTQPFRVYVAPNIPGNEKIAFRFDFSDGTYSDYQYYELFLNPEFVTIDVNKLAVTIASRGNIAYNGLNPEMGEGVRYKTQNLLPEGGLMVGNSPTAVSDNIRNHLQASDTDFFPLTNVRLIKPAPYADMQAEGLMQDSFPQSSGTLGIKVHYTGYAVKNAPNDKFVVMEYQIINPRTDTLKNLYAGMFTDWDIFDSGKNVAVWDSVNKMGYTYSIKNNSIFGGIKLLTTGAPSFYGIDNFNPPVGTIKINDGFTTAEKFQALSGGVVRRTAGSLVSGNDVSFVLGAKLPDLLPNDTATIALAVIAGDNLADLQASAQAAQLQYTSKPVIISGQKPSFSERSVKVYPNPAHSVLHIELPHQSISGATYLELTNLVGKTVAFRSVKPGMNKVSLNVSELAAGLYMLKTSQNGMVKTQKIQIIR